MTFQLTTSRRGRRVGVDGGDTGNTYFNSRPHEEVDIANLYGYDGDFNFNSRPHEEVDIRETCRFDVECYISTHDLTKRSTAGVSATASLAGFQLTTSRRGRRLTHLIETP